MKDPGSWDDRMELQSLGRRIGNTGGGDKLAWELATVMLTVAEPKEYIQLWFWFEEGLRNTVANQARMDEITEAIKGSIRVLQAQEIHTL